MYLYFSCSENEKSIVFIDNKTLPLFSLSTLIVWAVLLTLVVKFHVAAVPSVLDGLCTIAFVLAIELVLSATIKAESSLVSRHLRHSIQNFFAFGKLS